MGRPRKNPDDPKWQDADEGDVLEDEIEEEILSIEETDITADAPKNGEVIILETDSGEIYAKWRLSRHYQNKRWRPFGYWATQIGQQRVTDKILAWRRVA